MEKEYITALLFKNRRTSDGLTAEEELSDCDQQPSSEAHINLGANCEIDASDSTQNIPSLPQRLLVVIRQALELLDHKK